MARHLHRQDLDPRSVSDLHRLQTAQNTMEQLIFQYHDAQQDLDRNDPWDEQVAEQLEDLRENLNSAARRIAIDLETVGSITDRTWTSFNRAATDLKQALPVTTFHYN
jgi:ABC-type transporter Mla subunit MlaD